jgi:hypothetical protein
VVDGYASQWLDTVYKDNWAVVDGCASQWLDTVYKDLTGLWLMVVQVSG